MTMGKMRKYKNGIYGIRYMDYYIVSNKEAAEKKGKKHMYDVVDKDGAPLIVELNSIGECEWEIMKKSLPEKDLSRLRAYFEMEYFLLSKRQVDYIVKYDDLTKDEKKDYDIITAVLSRKEKKLPY